MPAKRHHEPHMEETISEQAVFCERCGRIEFCCDLPEAQASAQAAAQASAQAQATIAEDDRVCDACTGVWATLQFKWVQLQYPVVVVAFEKLLLGGCLPVAATVQTWGGHCCPGPGSSPLLPGTHPGPAVLPVCDAPAILFCRRVSQERHRSALFHVCMCPFCTCMRHLCMCHLCMCHLCMYHFCTCYLCTCHLSMCRLCTSQLCVCHICICHLACVIFAKTLRKISFACATVAFAIFAYATWASTLPSGIIACIFLQCTAVLSIQRLYESLWTGVSRTML